MSQVMWANHHVIMQQLSYREWHVRGPNHASRHGESEVAAERSEVDA